MPLFRSKFQPKKSPARKAASVSNFQRGLDVSQVENEFAIQFDKIVLELSDHYKFEFDDKGKWVQVGSKPKPPPANQKLQAENDLLQIQVELLLDMLTETTLEAHMKDHNRLGESLGSRKSSLRSSARKSIQ